MLRLVYAPKAYVFVRSDNLDGKVFNLSEDCVSGSVERNMGAESKATFVVRNRFRKYLVDQATGFQIFKPMDMVTIWLQRISGKPIQVFTGYLDTAVAYQMYPDNIEFQATCTLKRLSFQWFDPGLEFFTQWINHMKGWKVDPTTGTALNYAQAFNTSADDPNKITDGGFAQLISEFMTHIAGWNPKMVVVSDLPKDLPLIAAALYKSINAQDESALSGLENVMRNIMGISWRSDNGVMPDGTLAPLEEKVTKAIKASCDPANIPMIVAIIAARLTSGYQPNYSQSLATAAATDSEGNFIWGYGLYQMKPPVAHTEGVGHHPIDTEGQRIQGYKPQSLLNPNTATDAFIKALNKANVAKFGSQAHGHGGGGHSRGDYLTLARQGQPAAIKLWIEDTLDRKFSADEFTNAINYANKVLVTYGQEHKGAISGEPTASTSKTMTHLTWANKQVVAYLTGDDKKAYAQASPKLNDTLAAWFWSAKQVSVNLHLSQYRSAGNTSGNQMIITADSGYEPQLQAWFDAMKTNSGGYYDTIQTDGGGNTEIWHDGRNMTPSGGLNAPGNPSAVILKIPSNAKYPIFDGQTYTTHVIASDKNKQDPTNQDPTVRFEDMAKMSLNAAFTSQFAFPVNYIESHFLTGFKELANDTSCMDALSQFCQASMRQFMSLPSGELCCFYPDYFGAHGREPYWNIYDIEITNGGVLLNDQNLATHVFTIGDTFGMDGQIDQWDYVASRGVVTMDMPMMLRSFIQPLDGDAANITQEKGNVPLGKLRTAYEFYNHYGARPYKEEVPIIRNSFFEFLYAWQRFMQKWAATFDTEFEFTFQPEIMCGGIIGFPQHNLQMFVETVEHTWDYSQGFETKATLSSPAALKGGHKRTAQDVGSLPGFLLAGNINTVGLPSA